MITATAIFFFNRDITADIAALSHWHGFSRWWAILPMVVLFVYYLARANYQKFQSQVEDAEKKESSLNRDLTAAQQAIQIMQQTPAQIVVDVQELQKRTTGDEKSSPRKFLKYDIFIRLKLELKNLESISISQIRAELSLQGAIEVLTPVADMDSWRLFIGRTHEGGAGYTYHYIKEPGRELRLGMPIEGWLHYVSKPTNDDELNESALRVIVETPRGVSHTELEANTYKWAQTLKGRIVPDPDTTNIGLQDFNKSERGD